MATCIPDDVYASMVRVCDDVIRAQADMSPDVAASSTAAARVPFDTWLHIYRQRYQHYIRKSIHIHRQSGNFARYRALSSFALPRRGHPTPRSPPLTIAAIASSINSSAYLLCRHFIKEMYGLSPSGVSDVIRGLVRGDDPLLIPVYDDRGDVVMTRMDEALAREVRECMELDVHCSPYVDRVRACVGAEHEYVLQRMLAARRVRFVCEAQLRVLGHAKTPDISLPTPMHVRDASGVQRVVHWIDSKAVFGDADTHAEYGPQFHAYVARFGPGLVIYWFGHVASLLVTSHKDIAVAATLPPLCAPPTVLSSLSLRRRASPTLLEAASPCSSASSPSPVPSPLAVL